MIIEKVVRIEVHPLQVAGEQYRCAWQSEMAMVAEEVEDRLDQWAKEQCGPTGGYPMMVMVSIS